MQMVWEEECNNWILPLHHEDLDIQLDPEDLEAPKIYWSKDPLFVQFLVSKQFSSATNPYSFTIMYETAK